ncbi:MAG: isoprenylcysteine carboxylmethyltransferase family protein [Alphaproteobacteria bacterium]|nr:isoprenylcysteine carboxylmethyltransferase family protein [Alphaproteobacteria bacterium]
MRNAVRFAVRAVLVFGAIPALPLLFTGRWGWVQAWVFFAISVVGGVGSRLVVWRRHPGLITERAESLSKENVASWDKALAPLTGLGALFIPLVAGLEGRNPVVDHPVSIEITAAVAMILGYAFGAWAMAANPFFSGTVRLQEERGHTVTSGGPYRFVRHPGYAGALVVFLASPFLLDSVWSLVPTTLLTVVLVVRTALEDRWLHKHLPSYPDFAQRTRYRLLPGVW